jgi:ribosomal protein RSM22 (predicted rRNA methylase)
LRNGVAQLAGALAPAELTRRAHALSDVYREGGDSARAIRDGADADAYAVARLPATYAASAAVLTRIAEHAPEFAPRSLLDAGAGPGTASWAAVAAWPGLDSIVMLDRHPHLLALAKRLCGFGPQALRKAELRLSDLANLVPEERYDLVLANYAIAEIPNGQRDSRIEMLWSLCKGVLAIVEPGTPQGFARIRRCRDLLFERGAQPLAPCPGAYACPMTASDWCHFSVRLPRSRAHMRAKNAEVPFEDERFSFIAVARESVAAAMPVARILAEPVMRKPGVALRLCAGGEMSERLVLKRDGSAYKRAAKARWGDAFSL